MKHLLLITLFIAGSAVANTTTTLDFNVKKIKCSIFGNLKMKIIGLEDELDRTGINYVKSDTTRKTCKGLKAKLKQHVNRRTGSLTVTAEASQTEVMYEYLRHDNQGRTGNPYPYPYPGRSWYECEKVRKTKVSFPIVLDSGKSLIFSANSSIVLSRRMGLCPRF